MNVSPQLRKLAGESVVYGLSSVISRFLAIFLVPIYTRVFTPEDFGVTSLIASTMSLVAMFIVLGLDQSAHRWYWDTENIEDQKKTLASWTWCQILIALMFAFVIWALSEFLGDTLIRREDAKMYFRLSAMTLPLGVLGVVITNWLRMQRRPWATVSFSLGTNLFNVLLTITLVVVFDWGLKGIYTAQLVSAALATVIAVILMRDWIHPKAFEWLRLKEMMTFAFPMVPASLAYWIVNLSWNYFIQGFSSTAEVGLYQVGNYVASIVALITGAFQQAWGPFAMSIHKDPGAKKVYADVLLAFLWITCLLSVGLSLFSHEILMVFTTESYVGASRVVGILAFNYVGIGLSYIAVIGSAIAKTTKPYGHSILLAAILSIALNLILVPRLGKEGAALATLIAQSIVPVYVFYYSQKLYPIPYQFGVALKIIVFSIILTVLGGSISISNPFLGIGVKMLLISMFLPAFFVLQAIDVIEARRLLLSCFGKMKG